MADGVVDMMAWLWAPPQVALKVERSDRLLEKLMAVQMEFLTAS